MQKTTGLNFLEMLEANKSHDICSNPEDPAMKVTYPKGFWHRLRPDEIDLNLSIVVRKDFAIKSQPKKLAINADFRKTSHSELTNIANGIVMLLGHKWRIEATEIQGDS